MSNEQPLGPVPGTTYNPDDGDFVRDEELLSSQTDASPESLPIGLRRTSRVSVRSTPEVLVGRYRVERVISRSAREVVVQARHLELGQRVLLRHLTLEASASPEAVQRFQRGARRAREMRSEHAERVVDFGRLESGAPYRATELPLGPSLAEILRVRGPLPVQEAVDIVVTACDPVAEAHASGTIHRSLSPACIYVERRADNTPLVRVLDFGVADPLEPDWMNQEDTLITSATMTASLPYASPEQIRNPTLVDARSDIWAFGAILYELLAGGPLFRGDNALSLLAMIAADSPASLTLIRPDVPAELDAVILSCLEKDPEARPRSVVELALALAPFGSVEAQPAAARVSRMVGRTTRPPALPSNTPPFVNSLPPSASLVASARPSRQSAPQMVTVADSNARGWTMLAVGAALGVTAAVVTTLITRTSASNTSAAAQATVTPPPAPTTPPVLAAATAPAPLTAPAAVPAGQPVASVAVQQAPAPAFAPVAPAPVQVAPAVKAPVKRVQTEEVAPRAPARTAVAKAAAAESPARGAAARTAPPEAERPTADAKDLFSGLE